MFEHVEQFPLENPLEKSDDRAPLPMNLLARLAFQWPEKTCVFLCFCFVVSVHYF